MALRCTLTHLSQRSPDSSVSFVDPTTDAEWDRRLAGKPGSSFFQSCAWARVLMGSYGHVPLYSICSGKSPAELCLPLMEVSSPLTGRRGVSLPFSDFCLPLADGPETAACLQAAALEKGRSRGWKYLEFRGTCSLPAAAPSLEFLTHVVELQADAEAMFKRFEASVRRAIRKAESAEVKIQFETSPEAAKAYYDLHCLTRKRHGLPPQPFRFFQRIAEHVFQSGRGFVAIARHQGQPVSACVYFHHGPEAIYKFGASDFKYQDLRANNLVMWSAMKHLAELGAKYLHLGRSSLANEGLRRYKLGFGAKEDRIKYFRYDYRAGRFVTDVDRAETWVNRVSGLLPIPVLKFAGRVLYPHLS